MKIDSDFEGCSYYAEEAEEKLEVGTEKEVGAQERRSVQKNTQMRSQSVTQKDLKSTMKLSMIFVM